MQETEQHANNLQLAIGYARRLAESLARIFPAMPEWKPLDDLLGILTQIDNIVTGVIQQRDQAIKERNALAAQIEYLRAVAHDHELWIDRRLQELKTKVTGTHLTPNSYAYAEIPDWELKQKRDALKALAGEAESYLARRDRHVRHKALEEACQCIGKPLEK